MLLALLAAAIYTLSFPPFDLWPLAWVALAPLFVAGARRSPGRAAGVGFLFGVASAAGVSSWLPGMVADYFQVDGVAGVAAVLGVYTLLAAPFFAAVLAWLGWTASRGGVHPLLVGLAWAVGEWGRAHGPVANPWALLGYSQMAWPLPAQVADLAGPFGVGALVASVGAAVGAVFESRLRGRRGLPRAVGAVGCAVVLALGYGAVRMGRDATGPEVRVGLVQGAAPREDRFREEGWPRSLAAHLEPTAELVEAGAAVVFWPELALDFYPHEQATLSARIADATRVRGELVIGGLGWRRDGDGSHRLNSVYRVAGGRFVSRFDKVSLMPFSEAQPLGHLTGSEDAFTAGTSVAPLEAAGLALGVVVCSEAMHPDRVRAGVLAGADVLLNPTNDGWFDSPSARRQQLRAVAMRAIETRRYVIRPTANGITALIDPAGRVVTEAPTLEPAVLAGVVRPSHVLTPYVRLGDVFVAGAVVLLGVDGVRRRRSR